MIVAVVLSQVPGCDWEESFWTTLSKIVVFDSSFPCQNVFSCVSKNSESRLPVNRPGGGESFHDILLVRARKDPSQPGFVC